MANTQLGPVSDVVLPLPPNLEGLSEPEAARLLAERGPNRWVPRERLRWLREALHLLLDPMALMLAMSATSSSTV